MQSNFGLFGPIHLVILASVPLLAAFLAWIDRSARVNRERLRFTLATALVLNSVVWYGHLAFRGWLEFPENLPFELCDATLFVTVVALITLNALSFDLAWYVAAGTS